MRFVLPHSPDDRPAWLVRLGLFLYDNLGGRKKLPGTRVLDLRRAPEGVPLKDGYTKGFEYSDCWVDDSRLVILNAVDAAEKGAEVLTRTACTSARRNGDRWDITVQGPEGTRAFSSRALVNAAGPWVTDVVGRVTGTNSKRNVRLVKGSHIITPKFWEGQQAYLVQNHDKRVIFINPYEGDKALIGTTDIAYDGAPEAVTADQSEIDYLLAAVNRYFKQELGRDDVVQSFSGVRPLYDDGAGNPSAVTRDYVFDLETQGGAPLLNVFGGKITTFRKLAEHALQKLDGFFPQMGADWTAKAPLPGGDIADADFDRFVADIQREYPWLPADLVLHWGRLYGTRMRMILGDATALEDLGVQFGPRLFEAEVRYLATHEWAMSAQDILYRRTKENLQMSAEQIDAFTAWVAQNLERQT